MLKWFAHMLLLAWLATWCGAGAATPTGEKPRLAVLPLSTAKAFEEAGAIAEELRQAFVNSGRYIVIDRTLTDKILKEWETQQSGMTESDKAVKIGRLFNVQIIVTGKLTHFSSGGWHVSAVILDSQTGVTMKAKTVRHRGDFFSLLDAKLPQLSDALVGIAAFKSGPPAPPPAAGAAPPAVAKVERPKPAVDKATPFTGTAKKVAIFPLRLKGPGSSSIRNSHTLFSKHLAQSIDKIWQPYRKVSHVFDPTSKDDGLKWQSRAIMENEWNEGIFSIDPNKAFVRKLARELKVDYVLIMRSGNIGGGDWDYAIYFFDINSAWPPLEKIGVMAIGSYNSASWPMEMEKTVIGFLKEIPFKK